MRHSAHLRYVEAAALGRGLQAQLGELDAAGAGQQVPVVGRVGVDVPQEQLPLRLEAVVELGVVRDLLPLVAEDLGGGEVGVPDRLGGGRAVLDAAVAQARDRGALGAVDLELDQLVAVDADRPGGVDLGDGAALELEDAVGGVVGGGVVGLAVLVPALRDVGGGVRLDGLRPGRTARAARTPSAGTCRRRCRRRPRSGSSRRGAGRSASRPRRPSSRTRRARRGSGRRSRRR